MITALMQKRDICGVMVTYNPDDGFAGRLGLVAQQAQAVLVVDNHSHPERLSRVQSACATLSATLLVNDINLGVAAALNQGARWSYERGYAGVLFLDQDTRLSVDVLPVLLAVCAKLGTHDRVAVVGSNFRNVQSGNYIAGSASTELGAYRDTDVVLTSGSLISLASYQDIGPFREAFFIDSVDSDYCYRARIKGYRVIQSLVPAMEHSAGSPVPHRFLGRTVWTVNHSPQRCYYMMRNPVVLIREYATRRPRWAIGGTVGLAKWVLKTMCFEDNRGAKLRFIARGIMHGLTNTYRNEPL